VNADGSLSGGSIGVGSDAIGIDPGGGRDAVMAIP
jgi:hypothetical protein